MTDFLDTNVLVYAFDDRDRRKKERSLELLADESSELALSTQVLGEFYVTVTRKLHRPLSVADARQAVAELARLPVVAINAALVETATRTSDDHHLSYWDALIIEAAAGAGCERVMSEDLNDGQVVSGVRIVNPFVSAAR